MTNRISKVIQNGTEYNLGGVDSVNGNTGAVTLKTVNSNSLLGNGDLSLYTTTTATLSTAGWSSSTQTVSVTGVTASNTVIVSPAPSSISDYTDNGVYCSAQGSGTLTFTCDSTPSSDITINVVIMN